MKLLHLLYFVVLIVALSILGFIPNQSEFIIIAPCFTFAFLFYFLLLRDREQLNFLHGLIATVLIRVILLFSFPNLSDDIYRFIWDGQLMHEGLNPYALLPTEIEEGLLVNQSYLFDQLNSPSYYSIYPPLAQGIFYVFSFLKSSEYSLQILFLKLILLTFELLTIWVIYKLLPKAKKNNLFIYTLNPLVIIEIMGNVHFEGVMLCFLLWGVYFIMQNNYLCAGVLIGLSIASKLLTLLFIPFFIFYISKSEGETRGFLNKIKSLLSSKKSWLFLASCFAVVGTLFISFIHKEEYLNNYVSSLDLYNRKFEFNAGLYYLLRYFGYLIKGFNLIHIIGPILSLSTVIVIIIYSGWSKNKHIFTSLLILFSLFLILSRTVHPWYLILPVGLSVLSKFSFPILWSFLISFTYINYMGIAYFENLWVVAIEYSLLLILIYFEVLNKKPPPRIMKWWSAIILKKIT